MSSIGYILNAQTKSREASNGSKSDTWFNCDPNISNGLLGPGNNLFHSYNLNALNGLVHSFGAENSFQTNLSGRVITAMPFGSNDLLAKALVYIAHHDAEGAVGFILNNNIGKVSWGEILQTNDPHFRSQFVDVHCGGVEDPEKGFVIHALSHSKSPVFISEQAEIGISCSKEIISRIVYEEITSQYLFVAGCTKWGPMALENEIMNNHWFTMDLHRSSSILFGTNRKDRWQKAMKYAGINPDTYVARVARD